MKGGPSPARHLSGTKTRSGTASAGLRSFKAVRLAKFPAVALFWCARLSLAGLVS